jgi:hypothetical protein
MVTPMLPGPRARPGCWFPLPAALLPAALHLPSLSHHLPLHVLVALEEAPLCYMDRAGHPTHHPMLQGLHCGPGLCLLVAHSEPPPTKVSYLDVHLCIQQQVLWLQVSEEAGRCGIKVE